MWKEKSIAPSTKKFWLDFATDFLFIAASYTNLKKRQQLRVENKNKKIFTKLIGTEGALKRPMTYDNHPIRAA